MSGAIPPTTTCGRNLGRAAGATTTACRTFAGPNATPRDPKYRGKSGPLLIEDYRTILPLTHVFVEAAQQAGFPFTPDLSGAQMEGVGYTQMSRNGRLRGSTARTFLAQAKGRANLQVVTGAVATGLILDGKRCVVEYEPDSDLRDTETVPLTLCRRADGISHSAPSSASSCPRAAR